MLVSYNDVDSLILEIKKLNKIIDNKTAKEFIDNVKPLGVSPSKFNIILLNIFKQINDNLKN